MLHLSIMRATEAVDIAKQKLQRVLTDDHGLDQSELMQEAHKRLGGHKEEILNGRKVFRRAKLFISICLSRESL